MKITIDSFVDCGLLDKERVILKVFEDGDLGDYTALLSKKNVKDGENISSAGKQWCYWFPNVDVKKGDLIVLYSKKGNQKTKEINANSTARFFYWGFDEPIWVGHKYNLVLLYSEEWDFGSVPVSVEE